MRHHDVTDEVLEQTALYALGSLGPVEVKVFEEHLAQGCSVCAEELEAFNGTVFQLAASAPPALPSRELRERVLARASEQVVRSDQGEWEPGAVPGLTMKRLADDPGQRRFFALVHLEGLQCYRSHWHQDAEELYVLSGSLTIDRQSIDAGGFYAAPAGHLHDILSGPDGCTCLLVSPDVDEAAETVPRLAPAPLVVVPSSTPWTEADTPGLAQRMLFVDSERGTVTALVRMAAGSGLPRHRHESAEQIYLIEGDACVEGHQLGPGDFYRIGEGTVHERTSTEAGCTFLLLASRPLVAA